MQLRRDYAGVALVVPLRHDHAGVVLRLLRRRLASKPAQAAVARWATRPPSRTLIPGHDDAHESDTSSESADHPNGGARSRSFCHAPSRRSSARNSRRVRRVRRGPVAARAVWAVPEVRPSPEANPRSGQEGPARRRPRSRSASLEADPLSMSATLDLMRLIQYRFRSERDRIQHRRCWVMSDPIELNPMSLMLDPASLDPTSLMSDPEITLEIRGADDPRDYPLDV